jgi:hypothetical protein
MFGKSPDQSSALASDMFCTTEYTNQGTASGNQPVAGHDDSWE